MASEPALVPAAPAPVVERPDLPGWRWGEYADPADLELAEIRSLSTQQILEVLLRRATRHSDARTRSRELTAIDRALADPENGYLRALREERTRALAARRAAGESSASLARELGVGRRRVTALLAGNLTNLSEEQLEARQVRQDARRAARDAARAEAAAGRPERLQAERDALKAARLTERAALGAPYLARHEAGESAAQLAVDANVSRQAMASWILAAKTMRDAVREAAE